MPKPFIPPMKGNKTPFQPGQQPTIKPNQPSVQKPTNRRPVGRNG
jgi:hypothetical protein